MDQMSFAEAEYANKRRKTRREQFLEKVNKLVPWKKLESKVRRHYFKGKTDRQTAVSADSDVAHPYPSGYLQLF
jgi:hypothetical protein